MKKIAGFIAVFIFVTATAAILDKGWIEETLKTPESIAGWILGGSFGSLILYMFIRGAIRMWPILVTTFGISLHEVAGVAAAWVLLMIYFFRDGLIDSSAGFGAAMLLGSAITAALFWVWRRIRNIYIRLADSDESFQMPNMEYFIILGISLAVSIYLTSLEEGMFKKENIIFALIIIPLLFIVSGVCFYWIYYVIKASFRAKKYKLKEYVFTESDLVVYGSLRTVTIPCPGITSIKKVETYTGLSALPTAISRPKTTELLIVESRNRKSPVALTWPGEKGEVKLREEARRRGAMLTD